MPSSCGVFPKWLLGVLVAVSGAALIRFALTRPLGRHHRRLVAHGRTTGRGLHTHDVSLLRGLLLCVSCVRGMSAAPSGGVRLTGRTAGRAARRRDGASVAKRTLRRAGRRRALPAHRLDGCERYGDGAFGACLRVSWRYLLSDLYHPLTRSSTPTRRGCATMASRSARHGPLRPARSS